MLVLSRKKDECIVINNDITIVVVEIRGDKVRLGIEAPKEVPVHRREIFEAIVRGRDTAEGAEEGTAITAAQPSAGASSACVGSSPELTEAQTPRGAESVSTGTQPGDARVVSSDR